MMSDISVKENITEAGPVDVDSFLNEITGYNYDYKDPEKYGAGERLGVMAQDMPEDMTMEMEDGLKGIDMEKATSGLLGAVANINKRLKDLEA